jgi:hypothetical protein
LVADVATAIEFIFPSEIGNVYRIEGSFDLENWDVIETGIVGTGGEIQRFYSIRGIQTRHFRVEEDTP